MPDPPNSHDAPNSSLHFEQLDMAAKNTPSYSSYLLVRGIRLLGNGYGSLQEL